MKQFIKIKDLTFLLTIDDSTGQIDFYKYSTYVDDWSLEEEVSLETTADTLDSIPFSMSIFRTIAQEILQYVNQYNPPTLSFTANCSKKARIYLKLANKMSNDDYNMFQHEDTVYAYRKV